MFSGFPPCTTLGTGPVFAGTTNYADLFRSLCINYLKATDIEVGLLLNFGPKAEIKRKVFDDFRK